MSTRSCIGRATPDGSPFVYHHWDGYPSALGATLWTLYHGHFGRNLDAMLGTLIDAHPAGWSTINEADFRLPPGYGGPGPQCFCHGERAEDGHIFPLSQAASMGCEWAYLFDSDGRLLVLSAYHGDGTKMIGMFGLGDAAAEWQLVAEVDLAGPEPDWESL